MASSWRPQMHVSMVSASTERDLSMHESRWCIVMRQLCKRVGELLECAGCGEFVEYDALCGGLGGGCRFFPYDVHCIECCGWRRHDFRVRDSTGSASDPAPTPEAPEGGCAQSRRPTAASREVGNRGLALRPLAAWDRQNE
eukprot:1497218-Prymnesium_polylepis.1